MPVQQQQQQLPPLRIGLIGGGTVGGGVYELVMDRLMNTTTNNNNSGTIESTTTTSRQQQQQRQLVITKICVKDLSKPRTFHLNDNVTKMVTNVDNVINDPNIDMIVEVIGDNNNSSNNLNLLLAKKIVETSIKNNKMVITANKSLLANYMDDIEKLLLLQQQHNNNNNKKKTQQPLIGFEAAVCGGIPIIHTLNSCYTGDVIHQIQGICNGKTNYILEKMESLSNNNNNGSGNSGNSSGMEYYDALKEANEVFGCSTRNDIDVDDIDNDDDVEGYDVRAKICILAKLAFGVTVPPNQVPCKGITLLECVDFEYAKVLGCTIKLLGTAQRLHEAREWDGPLCVYVSPVMISLNDVLGHSVPSKMNGITVTSSNMGKCSYLGPGSGRYPTANSIVADICRLANNNSQDGGGRSSFPYNNNNNNNDGIELDFDYVSIFYIRIPFQDGLGIIKRVGELAELSGVSIHSILQNPIRDRMSADFCVTTEECKVSQIEELCDAINEQVDFCRAPCVFMPLMIEQF